MQLFTKIDDAEAIISLPGGVHKQVAVFHCNGRVFVAAKGGFIRMCAKFGETWGTSNPGVKVVDISQDVPGLFVTGEPRFVVDGLKAVA